MSSELIPNSVGYKPETVATELSAKLAARGRHVCLFVGAGASCAAGLPDVAGLQQAVIDTLVPSDRLLVEELFATRNLEAGLSRVRRIASLLDGEEKFGQFDRATATRLDAAICDAIISAVDIQSANIEPFIRLASWASRGNYHRPIEIFTVNYDLLIETGLERVGALFFDGFVGGMNARFRPDLVESVPGDALMRDGETRVSLPAAFVRVWKLHGSTNWTFLEREGHREIVRLGTVAQDGRAAAIYPSDEKYDESRRVPFVVLIDRFRRALAEPETLVLVTGYSFSDQDLNEMIFEAVLRYPRSEIVVFCYNDIPEVVSTQASRTRNLSVFSPNEAIIGGQRRPLRGDTEIAGLWQGGRFLLGDFTYLSSFLGGYLSTSDATE